MSCPADIDQWIELVKECNYLPENDLKVIFESVLSACACDEDRPRIGSLQKLCDYVCDLLLEESNVQPVSTPVTVCGDIHGQVRAHPHCASSV